MWSVLFPALQLSLWLLSSHRLRLGGGGVGGRKGIRAPGLHGAVWFAGAGNPGEKA